VSAWEFGRTLGVARSTIQDNLKRASAAGLAWPLAGDFTDGVLEQRLFAHAGVKRGFRRRAEPDWGSRTPDPVPRDVDDRTPKPTPRPMGSSADAIQSVVSLVCPLKVVLPEVWL